MKENDMAFMKEVGMLPIVPVIAKADTMTVSESNQFRKEVGGLLLLQERREDNSQRG